MTTAPPWVVMTREELDAAIDRAIARAREQSDSQWMQLDDVARMLDVERRTVLSYIKRNDLPCRYAGKSPVFRRDEVTRWLELRTESPGAHTKHGKSLRRIGGR